RRGLHARPGRDRLRHRAVRAGAASGALPGPRRDPDRRAARRGDGADGAPGGRVGPPRPLDDAHDRRGRDGGADGRVLPRREAATDPLDPRRDAAGRRQPAAPAEGRRRPGRRGRGDGREHAHRRPDPRGADGGDPGGDRRGDVLPDADLPRRPDRARPRRPRRPGRRRRCGDEPPRLPRRARARAEAPGRRHAGRRGGAATGAERRRARRASRRQPDPVSRGLRLAAGLALGIALAAGAARAAGPIALPSSDVPNLPGVIVLPPAWTSPPVQPEQLSYAQLSAIWHGAGAAYGVQWQVLAAINKVESNFGRNMGPSSAGATGWMQFMPPTRLRWGLDADGDGIADPWRAEDAVYSAARYLAASGGRSDVSGAVYSYNHAQWYVDEVLSLARLFHDGGAGATM